MSESKHTPGPWTWATVPLPGVSPTAVAVVLNGGTGHAVLRHDANGPTPWEPTDADKALIIAAPDYRAATLAAAIPLEALHAAATDELSPEVKQAIADAVVLIRAAIAKDTP